MAGKGREPDSSNDRQRPRPLTTPADAQIKLRIAQARQQLSQVRDAEYDVSIRPGLASVPQSLTRGAGKTKLLAGGNHPPAANSVRPPDCRLLARACVIGAVG
jgi:ABC-type Zn2+ transport system substrate-binding protein/surface adhesin